MLWCNVLALHKRHGWESHCTVVHGDYVEKELGVCRGGYFEEVHLKGKGNEKGGNDIDAEG